VVDVGQHAAHQRIAELAHVAVPGVRGDRCKSVGAQVQRPAPFFGTNRREQRQRQLGQVLQTLAQCRRANRQHGQAKVEILTESPGLDLGAQIAVGRANHAHVDGHAALTADAFEHLFLQHAQQLDLKAGRQVANLG